MHKKKKLTRGQMADARRKSGFAGRRLAKDAALNPGMGAVFGTTGRKLTVSDDLARFGAHPSLGGYSAEGYEVLLPRATKPKPPKGKTKGARKPKKK